MNLRPLALALSLAPLSFAQLVAPNGAGVTMGHLHIKSRDVAAQRKVWIDVLGGKPGKLGPMETAKLQGVIVLYEKGEPTGGTVGSVVNHIGFKVHSLKDTLAKAQTAGMRLDSQTGSAAFLFGPDELRIEVIEDAAVGETAVHHHVHFFDKAVDDTKAWYMKTFSAVPGKRGSFEAADVPGANLTFTDSPTGPTASTKGRSLDHIGFEVKNLEAFTKRLEAAGVRFDVPYRKVASLGVAIAFFTDPFGTYVELTEGLDRL